MYCGSSAEYWRLAVTLACSLADSTEASRIKFSSIFSRTMSTSSVREICSILMAICNWGVIGSCGMVLNGYSCSTIAA